MSFVVSQRLLTQQFQDMCRMVASHWSGSSFTKCIASLRQDIMRCKKCGSHSASIWVDMHPPCIAPNNLAEIPAIILASKKIAGWMTSTYPRSRLQNDQWQGVSWPIMVYGTCKADVEVKAVTWCCWWFGVVTEIIHRLESKWLFFALSMIEGSFVIWNLTHGFIHVHCVHALWLIDGKITLKATNFGGLHHPVSACVCDRARSCWLLLAGSLAQTCYCHSTSPLLRREKVANKTLKHLWKTWCWLMSWQC